MIKHPTGMSGSLRWSAVWRDSAGRLPLELYGGAESGHFIWIRPARPGAQRDILLEVEGLCVSGLPLYDVLDVLKNCEDPVRIKTAKAGDCPIGFFTFLLYLGGEI